MAAFPPQSAPSTTGGAARHHTGDMAQRFKLLTPMQRRVLDLLRQGKFNKQIAYELGAAESTVKAHVTAILRRRRAATPKWQWRCRPGCTTLTIHRALGSAMRSQFSRLRGSERRRLVFAVDSHLDERT